MSDILQGFIFFFNETATTEIYTLSLHDALPISFAPILYVLPYRTLEEAIALNNDVPQGLSSSIFTSDQAEAERFLAADGSRSEEHTSELQSRQYLVCRLLLEKKKQTEKNIVTRH